MASMNFIFSTSRLQSILECLPTFSAHKQASVLLPFVCAHPASVCSSCIYAAHPATPPRDTMLITQSYHFHWMHALFWIQYLPNRSSQFKIMDAEKSDIIVEFVFTLSWNALQPCKFKFPENLNWLQSTVRATHISMEERLPQFEFSALCPCFIRTQSRKNMPASSSSATGMWENKYREVSNAPVSPFSVTGSLWQQCAQEFLFWRSGIDDNWGTKNQWSLCAIRCRIRQRETGKKKRNGNSDSRRTVMWTTAADALNVE